MEIILQDYLWIVRIVLLLSSLFFFDFFLKKFLIYFQEKAKQSGNEWRVHLDLALIAPARLLLWIIALSLSADLLARHFELTDMLGFIASTRNAGIVVCFTWFLLRWKTEVYQAMLAKNRKNKIPFDLTSLEIFEKIFTVAVLFISLLVLLSLFRIDIVPLVTFGGIGAAALGFASKDVMANFFGGLTLYATRPFHVNDQVELPQKKLRGHIEKIGWYFTSIRDLDKSLIYVPNYHFPTEPVLNLSRMSHRRINEVIAISYLNLDKVPSFIEQIKSYLKTSSHVDQNLTIDVHLLNTALHGIEIEIKAYITTTRYEQYMDIRQEVLLQVCHIMNKLGIQRPHVALEVLKKAISGNN
jgi:MscS family membrane protein